MFVPFFRHAWTDPLPEALRHGAVSFGNFDGVHRGHQRLMQALQKWAERVQGPAVAITFDPPPVALLNPSHLKEPLTTLEHRAELLHAAGADHVVALTVDASLLALSATSFVEDVIQNQFGARAIVEGSNFRFGRGREGDVHWLNSLEHRANINFEAVEVDGVSSSRVREALLAGQVQEAAEMLGRHYRMTGIVVSGAQRGRTLGFPTANLDQIPTLIPGVGVYAVDVQYQDRVWRGAANIGPNPTFGENARKIEVHLLDFHGDLYGQELTVLFRSRIRGTVPFPNVESLREQIQRDIAAARSLP